MRALLRTASVALVTVAGSVAIALPVHAATDPVGVTVTKNSVGVTFNGQPVVGVSDYNGQVCAGIGEGVPACTPPVIISG